MRGCRFDVCMAASNARQTIRESPFTRCGEESPILIVKSSIHLQPRQLKKVTELASLLCYEIASDDIQVCRDLITWVPIKC